jgi:hypothetical protein
VGRGEELGIIRKDSLFLYAKNRRFFAYKKRGLPDFR